LVGTWIWAKPNHCNEGFVQASFSARLAIRHRQAIKRWITVFLQRFFETSQFKRSALPNAPKVGSGGSLSPRSDWRAPSDGHSDAWLQELEREVPEG
jgi:hypothetical protein